MPTTHLIEVPGEVVYAHQWGGPILQPKMHLTASKIRIRYENKHRGGWQ